jgi:hypothetical protein
MTAFLELKLGMPLSNIEDAHVSIANSTQMPLMLDCAPIFIFNSHPYPRSP